jgi:hypothetical protein
VFDTIGGLPWHPLVVHAVVVLLPLAVLGTIAVAVRPAWRVRFAGLNALVAVVGTALCPVATSSGESLEHHVGDPGAHAGLGDQLVWFSLPMTLLALALWWMQRRHGAAAAEHADAGATRSPHPAGAVRGLGVIAVLAVVAAVAAGVQVYRVGDSGAKAVWADQMTSAAGK